MLAEVTASTPPKASNMRSTRYCPGCSREKPPSAFDGSDLCRVCEVIAGMAENPDEDTPPKPTRKKPGTVYQRTPAVKEIAAKTKPAKPTAEKVIFHADELAALPNLWLVKDLIPIAGLAVCAGHPGTGKTFWSLDLALRIAQRQPVLYIAAEGLRGFKVRISAWKQYHSKPSGKLYIFPKPINLLDGAAIDTLLDQMGDIIPALIVVDTLARCLGGSENSTSTMNKFVANCGRLQERFDAAVLLVHHLSKDGASYRGSSVLEGAADCMVELRDDDGQIVLINTKTKDAALQDDQPLKLQRVKIDTGETSCVLLPAPSEPTTSEAETK